MILEVFGNTVEKWKYSMKINNNIEPVKNTQIYVPVPLGEKIKEN